VISSQSSRVDLSDLQVPVARALNPIPIFEMAVTMMGRREDHLPTTAFRICAAKIGAPLLVTGAFLAICRRFVSACHVK
jgi:uncharacterized ParB-like nuclease family protein